MRVCFPTTYLPQRSGFATYAAQLLSAWSMSDELQISVSAEQWAQESCNSAVDIWPTFERAENHVSRMIRRDRGLVADVAHLSRPMP